MIAGSGPVLRNAPVSERPARLSRPADVAVAEAPPPVSAEPPEAAGPDLVQARLDEAYQRGYEQGLGEGRRKAVEASLAAEMENARKEGLEQGMEAGLRAAREAAAASVNESLAKLERLLDAIPQQLHARIAALDEDMVALSFEALLRVLGETAASPEGLRALLRQALSQFGPRQLVEVRAHPDDLLVLANDELAGAWLRQRCGEARVQVVADPGIELGGVVLRSPMGMLDARLETQLAALRHALTKVRSERSFARPAEPAAQGKRFGSAQGGQP